MNRIVFAVLEILAAALFLLPVYWILNRRYFHSVRKTLAYCIFSFYLVAVYSLVGMPCITYVRLHFRANLIPFLGMIRDLKNGILNVLLFVPLGVMLPVFWEQFRSWKKTVCFGFCMSLTIELLQILTMRATDINDLITNCLGAALGYCIALALRKRFPSVDKLVDNPKQWDVYLLCGIVLTVMFFFQPFPAAWLWEVFH